MPYGALQAHPYNKKDALFWGANAQKVVVLREFFMNALAALSRFCNKTFALWVLVFAAVAYFWPETYKPLAGWISPLLGLVMFGMGLTLSVNDFKMVLTKPTDVLIGILSQFIIMPVLAYILCIILQLPAEVAVGVILVGCCPGGTSSNVMTFLARGDTALSVTITSCTTLLAPIVTPFLIWVFAHQWIEINPLAMFWSICQIVLLPIALGIAIHTILGHKRVEVAATALPLVSVVAIVLIVMAVVAVSQPNIAKTGPLVLAVVILHNGLGYLVGYGAAKLFKMNLAKRKCLAIEVGMQNSGLGVALATAHFATMPLAALPSAIFSFWHNISGPIVATIFLRMTEDKKETAKQAEAVKTSVA